VPVAAVARDCNCAEGRWMPGQVVGLRVFFLAAHAIHSERRVDVPEFSKRLSNVAWMAAITACL
jgi:hypothetical protein